MDWLETLGFPAIQRYYSTTVESAVSAFRGFAGSVAMKLVSTSVLHKSEVGGVSLALGSEDEVVEAFERMQSILPQDQFQGVLITPMVEDPVEALVGLSHDLQFGPVVAVGLGGIYTEVFHDVSLRVAPISIEEAEQMIDQLQGVSVLRGARGRASRDLGALAKLVSAISGLPFRVPGIGEMDLNPVFVLETGCVIGDVRVIPICTSSTAKEAMNP